MIVFIKNPRIYSKIFFYGTFFLCAVTLLFCSTAHAETFDRDEFVKSFLKNTAAVEQFNQKIEQAENDYWIAYSEHFPKISMTVGASPYSSYDYMPAYNEKNTANPEEADIFHHEEWQRDKSFKHFGMAIRFDGDIVLPIFTFGKIWNMEKAAKGQIDPKKAERGISTLKLGKEAASFYYSFIMAMDMRSVMETSVEKINEAEKKLEEMLYEENKSVSQKDIVKLRIEKEKLLYNFDKLDLTIDTLNSVMNNVLPAGCELKDKYMTKVNFAATEDQLRDYFLTKSAYNRLAVSGISAYESLYKYEISNFFPNFGAVGNISEKYTSSVRDSNYAALTNTSYNGWTGEAVVDFSYDINIVEQVFRYKKAKSVYKAKSFEVFFAKESAVLDIKRKYNELKALDSQIEHTKKSHKYAKGWMAMEFANHENGNYTPADLAAAVKSFIEQEYLLISAYYEYNMKVEDIMSATGCGKDW